MKQMLILRPAALLLAVLLLAGLALCGCTARKTPPDGTPEQTQAGSSAVTLLPANETGAPTPSGETFVQTKQALTQMQPVLDAILRTMGVRGGGAYAPDDPEFFWSVLYLAGMDRGFLDQLIPEDSSEAPIPSRLMAEIAGAAFSGRTELLPMPSDAPNLRYDAAQDVYILMLSDSGDTETRLETFSAQPDGTVSATVGLYVGTDGRYGAIAFTLSPNPDSASAYPYCVTGAEESTAPFSTWTEADVASDITADLDGDGVPETIRISFSENPGSTLVTVTHGTDVLTDSYDLCLGFPSVHIADIEAGDGLQELVLTGDEGSDDYISLVYRLENGKLSRQDLIGEIVAADGNRRITVECVVDVLGTYGATCLYCVQPDFTFLPESPYTILRYDGDWADRCLRLKQDGLPLLDGDAPKKGAELMLVSTDAESYAVLTDRDGALCTIPIAKDGDDWQWHIGNQREEDFFDGLMYAG